MHIGIAGNIGCGKTTLTRMLSEHYGWTPKYEAVTYNPYLEDYYKDIQRWSYNLETYFLAQRFQDLLEISRSEESVDYLRDNTAVLNIFVNPKSELLPKYYQDPGVDRYEKIAENKNKIVDIDFSDVELDELPNQIFNFLWNIS